ncbi:DUF2239 family protein [Bradyrhizobium erythrophlei]|uniref:DUF2239 domain-containing protein n=1 Tax=Bradyrhizobium erythrophlei TaxID=1437360 RepID=A0A1H5C824_9BRAD|nr:DUF2239 family protein [Bradyrhizobium erythrophlei]SED62648.1 hypothetical protein SAMN05444164_5286 [Bradyrhizobium erythrophlei]
MNPAYVAFEGEHRIVAGDLKEVARAAKQLLDLRKDAAVLVFNGRTSALVDIDFRGSVDDVLARLPKLAPPLDEEPATPAGPRGPGRPKLGVVAREITLLPRHWDWLAQQKGGASVAIRKLIDEARRASGDKDRTRSAQDAAYRFMTTMAGNRPNYEDAIRALFAHDRRRFATLIADWPADIRDHAIRLAYSDQAD